jgi:membrane protease YdiL (CAAX protease family)
MHEAPDQTPSNSPPPAASDPQSKQAHSIDRSFFRDVPWRWWDVLFCHAPWLLFEPTKRMLPLALVYWVQLLWLPLLLVEEGWYAGFTLWMARNRRGTLPSMPSLRRVWLELRWALALLPVVFAIKIVVFSVATFVLGSADTPNEGWVPVARSASRLELIVFALSALLVAPVAEELAFRGLLYNKLRRSLPAPLALILQAAAFGLFHHSLGVEFACAIAVGAVIIGLFYDWRKTIVAPMLLHALVNVVGVTIVLASAAADANSPRLGVGVVASDQGCVVTGVAEGSAADRAGIKVGDVITTVDGTPVRTFRELSATIHQYEIGDQVRVDMMREGKPKQVDALLSRP